MKIFRDLKLQSKDNRRTTRPNSPVSMASTMESERSLKQKFSITTHPRLPILMCSDGYMVTALQMTTVVTSYDIAALSLVETNHQLKILNEKFNLKVRNFYFSTWMWLCVFDITQLSDFLFLINIGYHRCFIWYAINTRIGYRSRFWVLISVILLPFLRCT